MGYVVHRFGPIYIRFDLRTTLTHYRLAMPFGNRKHILEDLFRSVLSKFKKKYYPSGNLKFYNFVTFQSLKLRNLMEKNPSIFT